MKNSLVDINMNNNKLMNAKVLVSGTKSNLTSINASGILSDSGVSVSDATENIVTSTEFTALYTKLGINS